jgi:hypothetical protein
MVVTDQSVLRSGAAVHWVFFSNSPRKTKMPADPMAAPRTLALLRGGGGRYRGSDSMMAKQMAMQMAPT